KLRLFASPRGSALLASRRRQVAQIGGVGAGPAGVGGRPPEPPPPPLGDVPCPLLVAPPPKQHREPFLAPFTPQCPARLLAAAASEPREDAFAASHQLLTNGLQVHHQAIVDAPQQDHDHR